MALESLYNMNSVIILIYYAIVTVMPYGKYDVNMMLYRMDML